MVLSCLIFSRFHDNGHITKLTHGRGRQVFTKRILTITVYYPEELETSDVETETGIRESQEVIDDFINKQKSENPNKKRATDTNTLFSAT